jgi:hypothetical protein
MSNPGGVGARPVTQVPLTCPTPSSKAIVPLPRSLNLPAENFPVELSGSMDVDRGHLDVADLAVCQGWSHNSTP